MYSIRPEVSMYARQVLVEGFCTTQRTLPSLLDNLELDLLLLARACVEVEDGATLPVSKSKSKQLSSFAFAAQAQLFEFEEEQETAALALRVISAIVVGCCWMSLYYGCDNMVRNCFFHLHAFPSIRSCHT